MIRKKIIVTGGAGFIGSHLVNYLIKKKYEILVIDNLANSTKKNINSKAIFKKIDIRNKNEVNKCFKEFSPDYVFHLAALTSKSPTKANDVKEVGIIGTKNIIDACVKSKIKKIVYSSSAAVYGNALNFPIKEKSKFAPINSYGVSKLKAENIILNANNKHHLNYSILRYSNVYGPGQRSDCEGGVISIFNKNIALSKNIVIYGDGKQTRDFIYIDDIITANYKSMLSPYNFIANASTKKETSIINLIKKLEKKLNKRAKVIFKPANKQDIKRSCPDNSLIKKMIKWKAKIKI